MKYPGYLVKSVSTVGLIATISVLCLLLASSDTPPDSESASVSITGNFGKAYTNGRFVVWTPKPTTERKSQGAMMMAASSANSKPPSLVDSINVIAEAPIKPDGTFQLTTTVSNPQKVYFYVLDATSADGRRLAPTKGQQFLLEPGELTITMDERRQFTVAGGLFNDAVINSWKQDSEYVATQKLLEKIRVTPKEESEEQRRARIDELSTLSNQLLELEVAGLSSLALNHDEPLVRKFALQMSWLVGDWYWEASVKLGELLPEDVWVQKNAVEASERIVVESAHDKIAIGTEILDFTAENLSGESFKLFDLKKDKSLVLLEFWASWCGPCRVEIPHMKKAYKRFKDKGFEIVSFTIDEFKEDWEIASEEEELPWPNLGMGPEADAATKYSITGVPANYLFDARTGLIVATDLRGHKLDEKLEETLQ